MESANCRSSSVTDSARGAPGPLSPDELRVAGIVASQTFDGEKKNLENYILMARCVFDAAVELSRNSETQADAYRSIAMNTSFNIAAACWPGWEDAHADISDEQLALALDMARFNVAVGKSLDAPLSRRFNGYWILGVHLLVAEAYGEARTNFEAAANCAEASDSDENRYMAIGWSLATGILASGGVSPNEELAGIIDRLRGLGEDGAFYAGQYAPALRNLAALQDS